MMFRKGMIGACVAVAAMAISGEAEANAAFNGGRRPSSVQVTNQSSKATKVNYVSGANQTEGVVAPNSVGKVPIIYIGATEDSFVSVKVGKLAARKFKISANEVRKLYERSGFTPDEADLLVDVRVNKHGVVELKRIYLRKALGNTIVFGK